MCKELLKKSYIIVSSVFVMVVMSGCDTIVDSADYKTSEIAAIYSLDFSAREDNCVHVFANVKLAVGEVASNIKLELKDSDALYIEYEGIRSRLEKSKSDKLGIESSTYLGSISSCTEPGKNVYIKFERGSEEESATNSYITVPHQIEIEDFEEKEYSRKDDMQFKWKKADGVDDIDWHIQGGCLKGTGGTTSETPLYIDLLTIQKQENETCWQLLR